LGSARAEFEECREAALKAGATLREVQEAAREAFSRSENGSA